MKRSILIMVILLPTWAALHSQEISRASRQSILDSAKVLESKRDYGSAIRAYESALKMNPEDPELMTLVARDLSWKGDMDSSLAVYNQVLVREPGYFDALVGHATVLSWKGEYAASFGELKKLLLDYPNSSRLLVLAARVSLWSGNTGDAIDFAGKAVEIDSAATDALLILAQAYERELDFESANEFVDRVLLLDPGNADAERLRVALRDEFRNKAALRIYAEDFGPNNRFSNRIVSLSLSRRVSFRVLLFAEVASRDIFGSRDVAGTVGGALRLSDKFSINGEFLLGPGTSTAQRERGTLEFTYRIMSPLSVSSSFQYMQFEGTGVGVFSPALDYYFSPRDMIMLRGYFGATTDQGSTASVLARLTLQVSDNLSILMNGSHGAEFYHLVSQSYLSVIATTGSLGAGYRFTREINAELDLNYTGWESSPWKHSYGGSFNLSYQW